MQKAVKKINNKKQDDSKEFATKGDIRELGAMMENVQDSISFIAENLVGLSDNVNNLDKRLSSDIGIIKSDVSDIKFDLKQKVSRDEFIILVKRVEKLESRR